MWDYKTSSDEWIYLYTADDERAWSYKTDDTSLWTLRAPDAKVLREYSNSHLGREYLYTKDHFVTFKRVESTPK